MNREEAINVVRCNWPEGRHQLSEALRTLIPELQESEDEIHRKWILEYLYDGLRKADEQFKDHFKAAIDWLERQKEYIEDIRQYAYNKGLVDAKEKQKPVNLDEDVELGLDRALQIIKDAKGNLCGYQSDDGIYECDHSIQTLERILKNGIEQKPAEWSEEDEAFRDLLICILKTEHPIGIFSMSAKHISALKCDVMPVNRIIEWLQSLRPQHHWKPSEEQMDILDKVYHYLWADRNATADMQDGLGDFIDELKNL